MNQPPLRLPPLDEFRRPLVEPLGHLVLQAAYLDNALYSFVAMMLPFGEETTVEQVAHRLRNWDSAFVKESVARAISDAALVEDVLDYFDRVGEARDKRHRMVHDRMEVGLDDGPDGLQAILLREGYQRSSKQSSVRKLNRVTPEEVATLAFALYDLRLEIDTLLARWREAGGPKAGSVFD